MSEPNIKRPAKRYFRPLTKEQWQVARIQFETGDEHVTLRKLAVIFNTSLSSTQKRCANEKWTKGAKIVSDARAALQQATNSALAVAAEKTGNEVAARLMKDLQPWIEREKRAQIQRAVRRSKHGQRRIDDVAKGYQVLDPKTGDIVDIDPTPKDASYLASAEEKYDAIIRRNLGMTDGTAIAGPINLSILTNQAAVQVVATPAANLT